MTATGSGERRSRPADRGYATEPEDAGTVPDVGPLRHTTVPAPSVPGREELMSYRDTLRDPVARGLFAATTVSAVGDFISVGALVLLLYQRTGTAGAAAAVFVLQALPAALVGAVGTGWLARIRVRTTLVAGSLLGAAVLVAVAMTPTAPVIVAAMVVLGANRVVLATSRTAAISASVTPQLRAPLVTLLNASFKTGQVLGFAIGGGLTLAVGTRAALLLDAATFLVAAVVFARLRLSGDRPSRPRLSAALDVLRRDVTLRTMVALAVALAATAALPHVLVVPLLEATPAWQPVGLAAAPAGTLVAMLLAGRSPRCADTRWQLRGHFAYASALALAAATTTAAPPVIVAVHFLVGAGVAWIVGLQVTMLQRTGLDEVRQISGAAMGALLLAEGLGIGAFGVLADWTGPATSFAAAAVLVAFSGVAAAVTLRGRHNVVEPALATG